MAQTKINEIYEYAHYISEWSVGIGTNANASILKSTDGSVNVIFTKKKNSYSYDMGLQLFKYSGGTITKLGGISSGACIAPKSDGSGIEKSIYGGPSVGAKAGIYIKQCVQKTWCASE